MGHCTDKAGMKSIYDLHDGLRWLSTLLYAFNKYREYVSGTVLDLGT